MASYAELDQIQGLMAKFAIGPSSTPNETQAMAIIGGVGSEIDVALAGGGVMLPMLEPAYFVTYLAEVQSWGATAEILKSMFPAATGPAETPAYAFWEKRYQDALAGLRSGALVPPEVLPAGALVVSPSSYLTNHPEQEASIGLNAEPMFKIHKVF